MRILLPAREIHYDFCLEFKGYSALAPNMGVTSPQTDDTGTVHHFTGTGQVVYTDTTINGRHTITKVYVKTYQPQRDPRI